MAIRRGSVVEAAVVQGADQLWRYQFATRKPPPWIVLGCIGYDSPELAGEALEAATGTRCARVLEWTPPPATRRHS